MHFEPYGTLRSGRNTRSCKGGSLAVVGVSVTCDLFAPQPFCYGWWRTIALNIKTAQKRIIRRHEAIAIPD